MMKIVGKIQAAIIALFALASLGPLAPATASDDPFGTGNDFLESCSRDSWRLTCLAYIRGMNDGLAAHYSFLDSQKIKNPLAPGDPIYRFCAPKGATPQQLLDVFLKFLRDDPAGRHFPSGMLFVVAMNRGFPCE